MIHHEPHYDHHSKLSTSFLGLQFSYETRYIKKDSIRIKCVATIPGAYWESSSTRLMSNSPKGASSMIANRSSSVGKFYETITQFRQVNDHISTV